MEGLGPDTYAARTSTSSNSDGLCVVVRRACAVGSLVDLWLFSFTGKIAEHPSTFNTFPERAWWVCFLA